MQIHKPGLGKLDLHTLAALAFEASQHEVLRFGFERRRPAHRRQGQRAAANACPSALQAQVQRHRHVKPDRAGLGQVSRR